MHWGTGYSKIPTGESLGKKIYCSIKSSFNWILNYLLSTHEVLGCWQKLYNIPALKGLLFNFQIEICMYFVHIF